MSFQKAVHFFEDSALVERVKLPNPSVHMIGHRCRNLAMTVIRDRGRDRLKQSFALDQIAATVFSQHSAAELSSGIRIHFPWWCCTICSARFYRVSTIPFL